MGSSGIPRAGAIETSEMRKSQPVDALQSWRSSKSPSSLTCSGPCLFPLPPLMLGAHTTSKIACWDLPGPWLWSGPHRAPGCTACARTHQGSLQPSGEDSAARSCSRANHLGLPQPSPAISATCTLGLLTQAQACSLSGWQRLSLLLQNWGLSSDTVQWVPQPWH